VIRICLRKNVTAAVSLAAVAAIVLLAPTAASASTNLVFNPGFEQAGCGDGTPVLCGWRSDYAMSRDTSDAHSGSASMHLECGAGGCFYDPDYPWVTVAAESTVCVRIGPGAHAASFWYRDAFGAQVSLDARFFGGTDCSTFELSGDSLTQQSPAGGGWQQVTGFLHAPTYAQSARLSVGVGTWCDVSCAPSGNFDDVYVADVADPRPSIASFTPTHGWPGTRVWIYGFDFLGATSVTFNGTPAQFTVGSDGFIDAYVPSGATPGPISVTTANGTGWSSSSFALVPPPTIDSFTPTSGPFGTVVDIHGSNLSGAIWVQFNFRYADFTVDSDSEIHATVPDGTTTGPISVTTVSGTGSSSSPFTVHTPTITSFAPAGGPIGTSVDIHGTNFSGATIVTFHSTRADFTVDSDSEIHATVPGGATTGWISVATPSGSALSSSSFTVTGAAPAVSSFTPASGPIGTGVDIHGASFTGATRVEFNGTSATYSIDSDSELHATVPNGATTGPISITTPSGTGASSSAFTVTSANAPPTARFAFTCTALTCTYDGGASSDGDGTIATYSWSFGDGTSGSSISLNHTYAQPTGYVVTLTVTDDDGANAADSKTVTLISLAARGYKVRGLEKVDLSWSGPSGAGFDVYRNGARIATVQAGAYTDDIDKKGSGTYTYKVCAGSGSVCSNTASVSF
jgi:hypothetical protein